MIVYFLRHASAGQHKADPVQDEKRPLDADGIEQCREMGRALAAMDLQVDAVISSPLKRATQTASLIGNEIGFDGKLQISAALRPEASYEDFRRLLQKHMRLEAIMVVGHNPSLSQFASMLISDGNTEAAVNLKKGASARIDIPGNKPPVLKWCLVPKMVRAIYDSTAAESERPKTARK
jgi:phosphohistidine phosphatase